VFYTNVQGVVGRIVTSISSKLNNWKLSATSASPLPGFNPGSLDQLHCD
jgi:hypothetical protein